MSAVFVSDTVCTCGCAVRQCVSSAAYRTWFCAQFGHVGVCCQTWRVCENWGRPHCSLLWTCWWSCSQVSWSSWSVLGSLFVDIIFTKFLFCLLVRGVTPRFLHFVDGELCVVFSESDLHQLRQFNIWSVCWSVSASYSPRVSTLIFQRVICIIVHLLQLIEETFCYIDG